MNFIEILTLVGIPILRSVAGWLENALEDGVISAFEWSELGSTVLRMGVMGLGIYFGFDVSALAAAGGAVVGDFILRAVKKN